MCLLHGFRLSSKLEDVKAELEAMQEEMSQRQVAKQPVAVPVTRQSIVYVMSSIDT